MIGTLFAQEYRATRKNLFTGVGIALLVAVGSFAVAALRVPVVGDLGLALGFVTTAAITPAVLGMLVENYWRTMYGREGYFTMTIPVRGRTLFTVKVLYAIVAAFVALVVTGIGLLGGIVAFSLSQGRAPGQTLTDIATGVQPWMVWFVVAALVLQIAFLVIVGAALMSIGAEARFNHLGFGAPVLGGILFYVVAQIVTFAAILLIPVGIVFTGPEAGRLVPQSMLADFIDALGAPAGTATPHVLGLGFVITSILIAALMAWRGGRSVERHTSLR
ncbi:hypothetical protein [Microbacterium sp.]|uniref:hypothetical protein n=1 Tax=Microbacterium sp. TaxID=51671 RepID=UPI002811920D|nr:hypothetical protein [Microbacterium sp.]